MAGLALVNLLPGQTEKQVPHSSGLQMPFSAGVSHCENVLKHHAPVLLSESVTLSYTTQLSNTYKQNWQSFLLPLW